MNALSRFLSFSRSQAWFVAAFAWVALLFAFFFPVVFLGRVVAPIDILDHLMRPWSDGAGGFGVHNAFVYDSISQYLPYDWAVFQSLRQDGIIGWNPWCYGGYALSENTMLCPGDWHHQLYRFIGFWTAWDLGIFLQFALAGFGVLVLLRGEDLSAGASLVAAVAFAFYSQHVLWIYHRWVLGASCWLPWVVWAIRRARRSDRAFSLLAVVSVALAFRGGHLQACLFTAILVFCLFLSDAMRLFGAPKRFSLRNLLLFYTTLAIGSALLASDVFAATIPPWLEGCKTMPPKGWAKSLADIPTLATALLPTAFGTPQTLDVFKMFNGDLFDLKYAGAIPLVLAVPGLFRRDAPLAAKVLFSVGLVLPFTPVTQWVYSRETVVFALGCAWLCAWSLSDLPGRVSPRFWRNVLRAGMAAIAAWTAASLALLRFRAAISPRLHQMVENGLASGKASRLEWMHARADAFLDSFFVWHLPNLVFLAIMVAGLFAAWKFSLTKARAWLLLVAVCTFGELFFWSRTWLTFSEPPRPSDGSLWPDREWTGAMKAELDGGGFLLLHGGRPDFDFFQINVQAGMGIPTLQGYETITPKHVPVPQEREWSDLERMASLGVSHVLAMPEEEPPRELSGWSSVLLRKDFVLFRNPAFQSRYVATLGDGSKVPLSAIDSTPNAFSLSLPADTVSVRLAMTHHPRWRWRLDDGPWHPLPESSDGLHAAEIRLPAATAAETSLRLRFGQPMSVQTK